MSELKFSHGVAMTVIVMLLLAGCVSQQKYDALQSRYDHLNQTMSSEITAKQMHVERLQNAIKVTVNDQLLFPSGYRAANNRQNGADPSPHAANQDYGEWLY